MFIVKKLPYIVQRIKNMIAPPVVIVPPTTAMNSDYDVAVPLRDGIHLSINIFRPVVAGKYPAIISFHPYGKDKLPQKGWWGYRPLRPFRIMRQAGSSHFSALTGWEAPDPDFWVKHGYAVINADMRGAGKSGGVLNILSQQEAEDYYDLIEWVATQSWCNGKVGLCGVSYLALSQYRVAALNPPHLTAICPWEGFSDVYKDLARPGGIREDKFFVFWSKMVDPSWRTQQCIHKERDVWWQQHIPDLKKITVPALICGSFSDQSLHTHGSFRAFECIASAEKWLFTHRGGKWSTFYSTTALERQLEFFDHFLLGKNNQLASRPKVRLEIRASADSIYKTQEIADWPPPNTRWLKLYIGKNHQLLEQPEQGLLNNTFSLRQEKLCFVYIFQTDTVIAGPSKLHLHLQLSTDKDATLFAGLRKFVGKEEIFFEGSYGYGFDIITKGWQKLSLRRFQINAAKFWQPEQDFATAEPVDKGKPILIEFPLMPSATYFRKGEKLILDLRGHWFFKPSLIYSQMSNYEQIGEGLCSIMAGETYDSHLLLPILEN